MVRGSCLCGAVNYEIRGVPGTLSHCHCSQCRKAHGAAFGSYLQVAAADFAVVSGAEAIVPFASSAQVRRTFCAHCGSTLQFLELQHPQWVWIAAGTLDDDPGVRPAYHLFTDSIAPWHAISDDLRRFPGPAR